MHIIKYYQMGNCKNGENCLLIHDKEISLLNNIQNNDNYIYIEDTLSEKFNILCSICNFISYNCYIHECSKTNIICGT